MRPQQSPLCCGAPALLQGPADVCGVCEGPAATRGTRRGVPGGGPGGRGTPPQRPLAACSRSRSRSQQHAFSAAAAAHAAPAARACTAPTTRHKPHPHPPTPTPLVPPRPTTSTGGTWRAGGATPSKQSLRSARETPSELCVQAEEAGRPHRTPCCCLGMRRLTRPPSAPSTLQAAPALPPARGAAHAGAPQRAGGGGGQGAGRRIRVGRHA